METEPLGVELFCLAQVGNVQVDMADNSRRGQSLPDLPLEVRCGQQIGKVQGNGIHGHPAFPPVPGGRIRIHIDLNAVVFGIVEVDRFAHQVVGGSESHALLGQVGDERRQIGAVRQQQGEMVESRGFQLFGNDLGRLDQR